MLSYFIPLILTSISEAKPLIAPVTDNTFVTIGDLKDFKILALTMIVMGGVNLLRWFLSFFSSERKELKERIEKLEDLPEKINQILMAVARIEDAQLTDGEVRQITRDEIGYVDAVKRSRN